MMAPVLYRGRFALALALVLAAGCRNATEQPAAGSLLLDVRLAPGAQMPDELRLSAYDDGGPVWQGARFPSSGAIVPLSATDLGTILLQPGATSGALRIDLRGLLGGALLDEVTLTIPAASISGGTFEMALSASLPPDGDGDGVPDPIDDCPSVPDPRQTGCSPDGGADGPGGSPGAGGGGGTGGSVGGSGGGAGTAGSGGTGGSAGTGGNGGAGGRAGTGGNAGAGGRAGTGGNAGAGGRAGTGGSAGTGGGAGAGGNPGTGGGAGAGGNAGTGGSAGAGGRAGMGGSAGATGNKGNGAGCGAPNECASGFCKDGVCCNSSCDSACQSCSTGKCNSVKSGEDVPECVAPMTCNGAGRCVAAAAGTAGTGG
jgi:hypothetical protein